MKEGYARKLSSIKKRLNLLGYDLVSIRKMYEDIVREHQEYGYKIKLSFDVFYDVLRAINVSDIDTVKLAVEFEENGYDFGEYVRRCVLNAPQVKENFLWNTKIMRTVNIKIQSGNYLSFWRILTHISHCVL